MTAQISDIVFHQGRAFCIAGVNGNGLFEPTEHGITPVPISTACWRGYFCAYEVAESELRLRSLHIGLSQEEGEATRQGRGPRLFGTVSKYDKKEYCFVYDNLQEKMPFTGGLLLATGFIRELYVHMGFHPAYKFREVYEFIFENGSLAWNRDCSELMAEYRTKIAGQPLGPTDSQDKAAIESWIEQCFSLDYGW